MVLAIYCQGNGKCRYCSYTGPMLVSSVRVQIIRFVGAGGTPMSTGHKKKRYKHPTVELNFIEEALQAEESPY